MVTVLGLFAHSLSLPVKLGLFMEGALLLNILVGMQNFSILLWLTIIISVIDAEVRYAVQHEYAQTAIDVLARRTRLSFLNSRVALDALPLVVDIMAEELNWTYKQRQDQIDKAVKFLSSMGIPPAFAAANKPVPIPRGTFEKITDSLWKTAVSGLRLIGMKQAELPPVSAGPGRSKFEGGEVAALRLAFAAYAKPTGVDGEEKVKVEEVKDILKELPAYADISRINKKDLDYVLHEVDMSAQDALNFDEFIEVLFDFSVLIRTLC